MEALLYGSRLASFERRLFTLAEFSLFSEKINEGALFIEESAGKLIPVSDGF